MKPPPGMEHRPALRAQVPVTAAGIVWMAVHGNLCLALRHPSNTGPSRLLVQDFVGQLGQHLVAVGILTPSELAEVQRVEAEAQRP